MHHSPTRPLAALVTLALPLTAIALSGCVSPEPPPAPAVPGLATVTRLPVSSKPHPLQPERSPPLRTGRYTLTNTLPRTDQLDLLQQVIEIRIPDHLNPNVQGRGRRACQTNLLQCDTTGGRSTMKRPSRLVLIQGAAVLLLVGCAVLFATKLATLSQAVQSRHCAEQIQRLQQQLQRLDHELEGLQPFPGVLKEDYQHAQQSALQRLAALETSARAVDSVASNVTTINTQVQDLEATLLTLKAAGEKCPLACAATTGKPARKARPCASPLHHLSP